MAGERERERQGKRESEGGRCVRVCVSLKGCCVALLSFDC